MATGTFDPLGGLIGAGLGAATAPKNALTLQDIGQAGRTGIAGLQNVLSGQIAPQINQQALSSYQNPYLDQSIQAGQRGVLNQFNNQILPRIGDTFANAGSFGSGRQAALTGEATRNVTQQLADIEAQQRANAYNAAYNVAQNYGGQQFTAQQNAAKNLFEPAARIAQDEPWKQALAGGLTGSNLAGQIGSGAVGSAVGSAASSIGNALRNQFPGIFGGGNFTPPANATQTGNGGYSWPTADGGQVLRNPDGSINVTNPDGSTQLFSANGQDLGTLASDADIYGSSSAAADLSGGDTSWIDNADWSSWF